MGRLTDHFKGKTAIDHIVETQARGIIASSETHGIEISGSFSAGVDAAKDACMFLLLINLLSLYVSLTSKETILLFLAVSFGWLIWKAGRSAWLGWSRLEHLHRILEEERWEIEHNRAQEREELKILYAAKGFEGKLLEDVLDVLMADGDRLLKIMVEEELGLSLEVHEHPLQQAFGAACGVLVAVCLILIGYWIWPFGGMYVSAAFILFLSSYLFSVFEGNQTITAVIWTIAIASLAIGSTYFLIDFLKGMIL